MEAVKSQGADLLRGRDVEDCEGGIDLQNEMLQVEEKWAKVLHNVCHCVFYAIFVGS